MYPSLVPALNFGTRDNSITPSIDGGNTPTDGEPEAMEVLLHGAGQLLENITNAGK
jgi:hypothetical protein